MKKRNKYITYEAWAIQTSDRILVKTMGWREEDCIENYRLRFARGDAGRLKKMMQKAGYKVVQVQVRVKI